MLDASAIAQVDSTARRDARGGRRRFAAAASPRPRRAARRARRLLERAGVIEQIGTAMVFDDLEDALRAFEGAGRDRIGRPRNREEDL